jgi:hypothetical protein
MQLRSGRRLALPPPAPQVDQRRSRRRVGGGDGDGVDRISGLLEELLLNVLGRFECAHQATRTSVLSHWWCGLWAQLRELRFSKVGAHKIEITLTRVRPNLNSLNIRVPEDRDLTGAQISSMLRAADQVAPAEFVWSLHRDYCPAAITFELPSFASATSIHLSTSRYSCTLAPGCKFSSLEHLALSFDSCRVNLGRLLPRCPRLCKLSMSMTIRRPIDPIAVESKSLTDVKFCLDINGPGNVVIIAPELNKLVLNRHADELTVSLSAPKMERKEFLLDYFCDRSPVGFGDRWSLRHLRMETEWSHRNGTPIPVQILFLEIIVRLFLCTI